jgi:hypothetical protein
LSGNSARHGLERVAESPSARRSSGPVAGSDPSGSLRSPSMPLSAENSARGGSSVGVADEPDMLPSDIPPLLQRGGMARLPAARSVHVRPRPRSIGRRRPQQRLGQVAPVTCAHASECQRPPPGARILRLSSPARLRSREVFRCFSHVGEARRAAHQGTAERVATWAVQPAGRKLRAGRRRPVLWRSARSCQVTD